jgi:hypothetical protein
VMDSMMESGEKYLVSGLEGPLGDWYVWQ